MPVILELEEYEADLVVAALMEGRFKLMKDWGDRWRSADRSPFEDDLAEIDADIVATADIRERLKEGIMVQRMCQKGSADPEKKVRVAWHHEHGWLPEDSDLDEWPFEVTDPEPTTAGIDVQTKCGKVRIALTVGGKTTTLEAEADTAARFLRDLDLAQCAF